MNSPIYILRHDTGDDATRVFDTVDASTLERRDDVLDNDNEHTTSTVYLIAGRIVHRSAHVRLKRWPIELRGRLGYVGRDLNDRSRFVNPYDSDAIQNANVQAMCSQYKVDVMNGLHAFGTSVVRGATTKDTYNAALFLVSGSRGAADTVYSTTGELAGTGNYTQGGIAMTTATAPTLSGTTAIFTPSASLVWNALTSSGAFDCMVMYNVTSSTKLEVAVFTFGSQSITAGTFTLTMPVNDASNALVRIA